MAKVTRNLSIERDIVFKKAAASWKIAESSVDFVRKIRMEWISRRKRIGP